MKKTLLLTTALVGALSFVGSAQADGLTIGAHVKSAYKSMDGIGTAGSSSGWSQERQIDLSSSGTLTNGVKWSAGFSLEQDAGETGFDGSEGNYVNISMGNTTLELGTDHILDSDYNIVPRAGNAMNEEIGNGSSTGIGQTTATLKYSQSLGALNDNTSLGVVQKMDAGTFAFAYYPKSGSKAAVGDTAVGAATTKSAYEAVFTGDLGVKGLNTLVAYANTTKDGTDIQDTKLLDLGVSYSTGQVAFGFERAKADSGASISTTTTEYGLVYKLNDQTSIGVGATKTEADGSTVNEKIKYLQIGYNLGAIGLQVSYIDADGIGYVDTNDTTAYVFKVNTKF